MTRVAIRTIAALSLAAAASGLRDARGQDFPTEFKNLQVFDKKIAPRTLKKTMDGFTEELGVKCTFCHNLDNYASDEREKKGDARKMIQLVQFMRANKAKYFKAKLTDDQVSCASCHRGKSEPDPFVP